MKVFVYGTDSLALEYNVKRELEPGDILIATNMAGHGTDLKISQEVKKIMVVSIWWSPCYYRSIFR